MAAYKQLNSQDIIISPLEVNKGFTFQGNELTDSNVGVNRFIGKSGDFLDNQTLTGDIVNSQVPEVLIYNSIKQLYYTNYLSGSYGGVSNASTPSFNVDGTITGERYQTNYYNYNSTTLNPLKFFPTGSDSEIAIISIPQNLFGDNIKPKSLNLEIPSFSSPLQDTGDGMVFYISGSNNYLVGNLIYQHGIIVLYPSPDKELTGYGFGTYGGSFYGDESFNPREWVDNLNLTCSFSSSHTLYETQYKCTITPEEFNYSLNPSVLTGSKGDLYPQFTSSYFDPYVTTVGIYNNNHELLMVGKLSEPLPTSRTTDTTILINLDR